MSFWKDPLGVVTWWQQISTHEEPVDQYLAQLDSLDQLAPENALEIVRAIQRKLDRGEIPGPDDLVAQLRTKLAELYNKYLSTPSAVTITPPAELEHQEIELEDLIRQAEETLYFKARQWKDRWWAEAIERMGRHGSPFFAEGGQPIMAMTQLRVALKADGLYGLITHRIIKLKRIIDDVKNRGASPEKLNEIQPKILELYRDYTEREAVANGEILAFVNTYDLFLGMQNFTNLVNQYVVGKFIFGFLNYAIVNPMKWLTRMTKTGRRGLVTPQLDKAEFLRDRMFKEGHYNAWRGYTNRVENLESHQWHSILTHGTPKEPVVVGPRPGISREEIGTLLEDIRRLPLPLPKGIEPLPILGEIGDEIRYAVGLGVAVLASQVGAELKTHAKDLLERGVPGGLEELITTRLDPIARGEEKAPGAFLAETDRWLEENRTALEEIVLDEAAAIADRIIEEQPVPTATNAEEVDRVEREMWARRVITLYEGIGKAREYVMVVQLFGELQAARAEAKTDQEFAWIDGLILAAGEYVKNLAHEQGLYPELGVKREPDTFATKMKVETE